MASVRQSGWLPGSGPVLQMWKRAAGPLRCHPAVGARGLFGLGLGQGM